MVDLAAATVFGLSTVRRVRNRNRDRHDRRTEQTNHHRRRGKHLDAECLSSALARAPHAHERKGQCRQWTTGRKASMRHGGADLIRAPFPFLDAGSRKEVDEVSSFAVLQKVRHRLHTRHTCHATLSSMCPLSPSESPYPVSSQTRQPLLYYSRHTEHPSC
jgi:hypothetical protein